MLRVSTALTINQSTTFAGYYGSFYSSLDQTDGTTPHLMFCENTADADGVSMEEGAEETASQITFAHDGTYNIQFSAQFHHTSGGGSGNTVNVWFKLNGSNIANSDTKVTVQSNTPYVVASWNFIVSVAAGDYVEIAWLTDNANIILEAEASTVDHPAVPSLIITAQQIR